MEHGAQAQDREALARAEATIAQQAEQIERLHRQLEDQHLAHDLREGLSLAATAARIAMPSTHVQLLEMVVRTAARVIAARAASLFLLEPGGQEMSVAVALGEKANEVRWLRMPVGHGIAGLVAATGQPMAVADARSDPRQASDIAQMIGYLPQSILCVPLFYEEQVIGVLELLDKEGAPAFSATDMEVLGLFANQAAVAIEQSRTHRSLAALIGEVLESLTRGPEARPRGLQERLGAYARQIEDDPAFRQSLELAQLVREVARQGERELKACQGILHSFADYLRSRPELLGGWGMTP
ncbi:MAG: GAF domain-containing protein [Chloroflexi bacterium]|nr:GAF domain-containing protein [Chloroflexota bacterium]